MVGYNIIKGDKSSNLIGIVSITVGSAIAIIGIVKEFLITNIE